MSPKKRELLSATRKRTSEWVFSLEIPTNVTVRVGGASFSLHKFPLASKCGYIRKVVTDCTSSDHLPAIEIPDIPGGAEAFERAAKFCYGFDLEINIANVAMLRCAAEYLEMTEDYAVGNLVGKTEAYLNEVALQSLSGSVSILHTSENLLPMAENVKLVSRCIDAISYLASKDSQYSMSGMGQGRVTEDGPLDTSLIPQQKTVMDWWAEDLTLLNIEFFQRVLMAMMARGFNQYALCPILMLYAQRSLGALNVSGKMNKRMDPGQVHEKRVVLGTVVSLLPKEKNALSVSFLSMLLRCSIYLEATAACRLDLEKRMALQLEQAVIDDLLIPSYSTTGDTLFDVDTVTRIMMNYLEYVMKGSCMNNGAGKEYISAPACELERVGKLMENYIAKIASDQNLSVSKFIDLVELIPEQPSIIEDGIYRAIDIFLKAHPDLSETERKKVCSSMDCQKLSREACAHAAQNKHLPAQTVVQVLHYEHQRFREAMVQNKLVRSVYSSSSHPVSSELACLRRENEDLKLELVKMKTRLEETQKSSAAPTYAAVDGQSGRSSIPSLVGRPPLPWKSLVNSVSKKLGRLYPFVRGDVTGTLAISKSRTKPTSRGRRHSIS